MNKEIKEILDDLKEEVEENILIEVRGSVFKPLLDYITNLQEENRQTELLKERYQLEKEDYKSRINKALEYTTQNTEYLDIEKGEVFECKGYKSNRVPIIMVSGLLDILRGESNE